MRIEITTSFSVIFVFNGFEVLSLVCRFSHKRLIHRSSVAMTISYLYLRRIKSGDDVSI